MVTPIDFPAQSRFLLVRPDKIGDLVLTLPALQSLRAAYPQAHIAFLCSSYAAPVLQNNPLINEVFLTDDPDLLNKIKTARFDAALHFYVDSQTAWLTRKAKIPLRFGPFSKLAALALNRRVSQHRSRVEKHEAEYNWDIVRLCGAHEKPQAPKIFLTDAERAKGREILAALGETRAPIFIHPGSAGSAARWSSSHFIELGHRLAAQNEIVVFTGGAADAVVLGQARITYHKNIIVSPPGAFNLRDFTALIACGKLFIANSTGPLHIAGALGVPTLSFYPRLPKVTSAVRWAPFGNPELNTVITPVADSLSMETILVQEVLYRINQKLA